MQLSLEPTLCLSGSDAIRWATHGKRKVRLTWHAYHPCGSRIQKNLLSTSKTPPLTSFQSVGPNHCYLSSRVISNDFVIADELWSKLPLQRLQKQECQSGSLSKTFTWSGSSMVYSVKTTTPNNCTQVQTIVEPSFLRRSPSQELLSAGRKDFIPLLPCLDGLKWSCSILTVEASTILHQLRLVVLLYRIPNHITKGCRIGSPSTVSPGEMALNQVGLGLWKSWCYNFGSIFLLCNGQPL